MTHLELFHITIGQDPKTGDYLGGMYSTTTKESGGVRDKNLYKVMREISKRVKDKEKERRCFPVNKQEDSTNLIVLPNGRV